MSSNKSQIHVPQNFLLKTFNSLKLLLMNTYSLYNIETYLAILFLIKVTDFYGHKEHSPDTRSFIIVHKDKFSV